VTTGVLKWPSRENKFLCRRGVAACGPQEIEHHLIAVNRDDCVVLVILTPASSGHSFYEEPAGRKLSAAELIQLRTHLASAGLPFVDDRGAEERLIGLRQVYEPYILALSKHLSLALATWSASCHRTWCRD